MPPPGPSPGAGGYRTSATDPLRIDTVATPGGGLIGMAHCPGKVQSHPDGGGWRRDLDTDLDRVREWGAVAVVTLMQTDELVAYHVGRMGEAVQARSMEWHHLPIADMDVPRQPFETAWAVSGPILRAHLLAGRRILLHCLGGLGRSGTIAARLLVEFGLSPHAAIETVRAARPGMVETTKQEAYVLAVRPVPGS